jgi:hypothetical protein
MGVAIDTIFGTVVEHLLKSGVTVYPVNPICAKCWRERQCPGGNMTDFHDAWAEADA